MKNRNLFLLVIFLLPLALSAQSSFGEVELKLKVKAWDADKVFGKIIMDIANSTDYTLDDQGLKRYHDMYFDDNSYSLYNSRMILRVRHKPDGRVSTDFKEPVSRQDGTFSRIETSEKLPRSTSNSMVSLLKNDEFINSAPFDKAQKNATNSDLLPVLEVIDDRYILLFFSQPDSLRLLVTLDKGVYKGLVGKKIELPFAEIEVEFINENPNKKDREEHKKIADYIRNNFEVSSSTQSKYERGIDLVVKETEKEHLVDPIISFLGRDGYGFNSFNQLDAVRFINDQEIIAGDTRNARFHYYSWTGSESTHKVFGKPGSGLGEFSNSLIIELPDGRKILNQVQGIAIFDNVVFIVDQGNSRIQAFDSKSLEPLADIGKSYKGLLRKPTGNSYTSIQGLAIDNEGNMYLSDQGMGIIYKLDRNNKATVFVEGLKDPESLSILNDDIIIAEEGRGQILKISLDDSTNKKAFGSDILWDDVEGIRMFDWFGRKIIAAVNPRRSRVEFFEVNSLFEEFNHVGSAVLQLNSTDGIDVSPNKELMVLADQGNSQLLVLNLRHLLHEIFNADSEIQVKVLKQNDDCENYSGYRYYTFRNIEEFKRDLISDRVSTVKIVYEIQGMKEVEDETDWISVDELTEEHIGFLILPEPGIDYDLCAKYY